MESEMDLIADSGSSKTSWLLTKNGVEVESFRTNGLNPYFHSHESAVEVIQDVKNKIDEPIDSIYFYGAGCSNAESKLLIENAVAAVFSQSKIFIEHDLLAAARALCGTEPGIAAILGTGSNCCVYDGVNITRSRRALGYVLGDEGSGSNIGKQLLKDYLNEDMPDQIAKSFLQKFGFSDADILQALYKNDFPNRFLASLAPFVSSNKDNEYCRNLIRKAFEDFMDRCVLKFPESKSLALNIVGSVGYYNQELLEEVCKKRNIQLGKVLREPIHELVVYHQRMLAD